MPRSYLCMGWICTMLRSEPPPTQPHLLPVALQSVFLMWQEHVCAPVCLLHWISICVSAEQTMREAITMGTAGLSYCGWLIISSPLACFHVSEYVRASLCKIRGEKTGKVCRRDEGGIFEQHRFKKLIFFMAFQQRGKSEGSSISVL